jgi:hypothetical protein
MPQVCKVSQRRFSWNQFSHPDSGACRPPIPNQGDHRFQCPGKTGRHASERLVGMLWNEWTASIGIDGRHGPDYAAYVSSCVYNRTLDAEVHGIAAIGGGVKANLKFLRMANLKFPSSNVRLLG